jgi:hypothetical protein
LIRRPAIRQILVEQGKGTFRCAIEQRLYPNRVHDAAVTIDVQAADLVKHQHASEIGAACRKAYGTVFLQKLREVLVDQGLYFVIADNAKFGEIRLPMRNE